MFSVAGFMSVGLLPEDKNKKIFGINNRIVFAVGNALFFSVFEIFLASTPAFIWVYKWWGALPVFVTTYIPFFLAANLILLESSKTYEQAKIAKDEKARAEKKALAEANKNLKELRKIKVTEG